MDSQNSYNGYNGYNGAGSGYSAPMPDHHRRLATAAMILSIIGIVFGIQVFGLAFSGVAIVLALLSKGDRAQLEPRGRTALILGFTGLAIGIITTVAVTYSAVKLLPQMVHTEEFRRTMEQFYGEDTDAAMQLLNEWIAE